MIVFQILGQTLVLLLLAPLVQGLIKKFKALLQNRFGPPLLQPYRDLAKLLQREAVVSEHASWVFRAAPWVGFAAVVAAGLLVPLVAAATPFGFAGDLLAVTFLFALARFFTALAAMDTGSAFGGMGASREMAISSLVEPAMLLALFSVALVTGSTDLGAMAGAGAAARPGDLLTPAHFLALAGLYIALLAETGRVPVDNPDTHLELTMIHEGMLLEFSGRHLALAAWTHMVKQLVLFALLANVFFPWGIATSWASAALAGGLLALAGGLLALAAKLLVLAGAVAVTETAFAKLRLFRVPDLLGASFVLSLLALVSEQVIR